MWRRVVCLVGLSCALGACGAHPRSTTGSADAAGVVTAEGGSADAGASRDGTSEDANESTDAGCIADEWALPGNAGVLNVMDFGAMGDGVHDDTEAIEAAIEASAMSDGYTVELEPLVYLPKGTYLVSDTLRKTYGDGGYASGLALVGASRCATTIKLSDAAAGFGDATLPKGVVYTSSKLLDMSNAGIYDSGSGNDAYFNYLEHLTIDVGNGNPGATAIDYIANNQGAIRDVAVRAPAGSGAVGIDMTRPESGPCLLTDVEVDGFQIGIDVANTEYSITFENMIIDSVSVGLRNNRNMLSMRNLTVRSPGVAIANTGSDGMISLQGGTIEAMGGSATAIQNAGTLALVNVTCSGASCLDAGTGSLDGVFQGATRISDLGAHFSLAAEEPPPTFLEPTANWASVTDFGAAPDDAGYVNGAFPDGGKTDSTAAIQMAMNSGHSTVYFPHGIYYVSGNITVPEGVQRIVGLKSTIHTVGDYDPAVRNEGWLRFQNTSTPVTLEHMSFDNAKLGTQLATESDGAGTVVLRDVWATGAVLVVRAAGGGTLFLEDTDGAIQVAGPAPVFARQLNIEGSSADLSTGVPPSGTPYFIINKGTPLWILGMKTENDYTALDNQPGAVTEIFGGLFYMVDAISGGTTTLFSNDQGKFSASFVEEAFVTSDRFTTYLEDIEEGGTTMTPASQYPLRAGADVGRVAGLLSNE